MEDRFDIKAIKKRLVGILADKLEAELCDGCEFTWCVFYPETGEVFVNGVFKEVAEFITNAHNDIAALLEALEVAEAERNEYKKYYDKCHDCTIVCAKTHTTKFDNNFSCYVRDSVFET